MENMNENVEVMNAEVDAAAPETESTKPSAGSVVGGVAVLGLAGYGLYKLGQKVVGFFKGRHEARLAKKANGDAVEITATDITDAE